MKRIRSPFVILLLVLLLGMALRLYQLDADSLWLDEVKTGITSRLDFVSMVNYQAEKSVHPPLLYMVTHFFLASMGESDFVVRLPAALLGSLSLLLVYEVGKLLWTRREGVIGAFLLAISAYHVRYSQEARHYSLMVFLGLLSLIFLLKALQRGQWRMWILFALSTSLNLYTHYFAFLILPSELVFAAWVILDDWRSARAEHPHGSPGVSPLADPDFQSASAKAAAASAGPAASPSNHSQSPRKQALCLVTMLALVGLSYVPWLPFLQQQLHSHQIQYQGFGLGALPRSEFSVPFYRDVLEAYTSVEGIALALYLALFALGLASSKPRHIVLFGLWITLPFLFPLVVRSSHFFDIRYAIYVVPLFLLGMARGIAVLTEWLIRRLPRMKRHQQRGFALASVLVVCVFGALSVVPLRDYYQEHKEDWRDATAYLLENMGPGDIVIADGEAYGGGGDSDRTLLGLSYYFSRAGKDVTVLRAESSLATGIEGAQGSNTRVWGVLWHLRRLSSDAYPGESVQVALFPRVAVVRPVQESSDITDQAMSILSALSAIQPSSQGRIDLHLSMATLSLLQGDSAQAMTHAELAKEAAETLSDDSAHAGALVKLGTLYRDLREPAEALASFQRATKLDPQNAPAMFRLGETYLSLGNVEKALAAYHETLRLRPSHATARTRVRDFSAPPFDETIPNPLVRSMGLEVAFLGYDLDVQPAKGTISLTAWWQGLTDMDRDYSVFVHLMDADGRLSAQADQLLQDDGHTTSTWKPGMGVRQVYDLELPAGTPPGEYRLCVGLYYWATGERLPVWDENGQRLPDDVIPVETIAVTG
jgi:mannosyltransferase